VELLQVRKFTHNCKLTFTHHTQLNTLHQQTNNDKLLVTHRTNKQHLSDTKTVNMDQNAQKIYNFIL